MRHGIAQHEPSAGDVEETLVGDPIDDDLEIDTSEWYDETADGDEVEAKRPAAKKSTAKKSTAKKSTSSRRRTK